VIILTEVQKLRENSEISKILAGLYFMTFVPSYRKPNKTKGRGSGGQIILKRKDIAFKCSHIIHTHTQADLVTTTVTTRNGKFDIISGHAPPDSKDKKSRENFFNTLDKILKKSNNWIAIGDWNAKDKNVGANTTTDRNNHLMKTILANHNAISMNRKLGITAPTCFKNGGRSTVDDTLVPKNLLGKIRSWEVLTKLETWSDHQACLLKTNLLVNPDRQKKPPNRKIIDTQKLLKMKEDGTLTNDIDLHFKLVTNTIKQLEAKNWHSEKQNQDAVDMVAEMWYKALESFIETEIGTKVIKGHYSKEKEIPGLRETLEEMQTLRVKFMKSHRHKEHAALAEEWHTLSRSIDSLIKAHRDAEVEKHLHELETANKKGTQNFWNTLRQKKRIHRTDKTPTAVKRNDGTLTSGKKRVRRHNETILQKSRAAKSQGRVIFKKKSGGHGKKVQRTEVHQN